MQIAFRPIEPDEVDQLMDIAIRTFKQSYEHLNTPANFKWYLGRSFTRQKLMSEIENEESFYYFVISEDEILGYLKLNVGESQTEQFSQEYIEIERIYLDEKYQRKGQGKKMMEFAFDQARRMKKSKIWLGVWDQNPNATQFYQHIGFRIIGDHIFKFGDEDQTDLIMEIDVS